MKHLLLCALLASPPVMAEGLKLDFAREDWHRTDTVMLAGTLGMLAVDWAQTRNIARNPSVHEEGNLLLGAHPSSGKVNAYFLSGAAVTTLLAYSLPPTERRWILGGLMALEGFVILKNKQAGVRLSF